MDRVLDWFPPLPPGFRRPDRGLSYKSPALPAGVEGFAPSLQYPLNSSDCIRLLQITRGGHPDGSGLTYTMTTVRLEEAAALKYHALSYVWGERALEDTEEIVIDGKIVHVGKNLYEILWQLQRSPWQRYLWVDAVCIDQRDTDERNSQVQMMADIYRRAETVHAWLGTGERLLRDWLANIGRNGVTDEFPFHSFLYELASCEYWSRAWVVQELACAAKIVLRYADQTIPASALWDYFLDTAKFKDWFVGDVKQTNPDIQRMVSILRRTQPNPDPELQPFESIIHDFSHQRCSEPRDHIYAFRALYQDRYKDAIPVDYKISIAELIAKALPCCETRTNLHSLFTILNSWDISDEELTRDVHRVAIGARLCPQLPNLFRPPTDKAAIPGGLLPHLGSDLEIACGRSSVSSGGTSRKYVLLPKEGARMVRQTPCSSWCVALLDADYDLMTEAEHSLQNGKRPYGDGFPKIGGIAVVAQLEELHFGSYMETPAVGIWLQKLPSKPNAELRSSLQRLNHCRKVLEHAFSRREIVSFEYSRRSEISVGMTLPSWNVLSRSLQDWRVAGHSYNEDKVFRLPGVHRFDP